MHRSSRAALILLLTVGGAACGDSAVTTPTPLLLTTDSASYTAVSSGGGQVVVKLVIRYRNPTSGPVVLDRCFPDSPHPLFGVELVAPTSSEGAAYDPGAACVGHNNPIVVAAGETRIDTLVLHGPNSFDSRSGRSLGVMEGSFRIAYGTQRSNEFRVTLPPGGVVPGVPRDLSTAIQTDSLLVHMTFKAPLYRVTTPIHVTIYNPRPDTSFILNCGGLTGISLEKQTGTQWVTAWSPPIPACLSPAIVIAPGGKYETGIDVYGVPPGVNAAPSFTVSDIPGVYRLVWSQILDAFTFPGPFGTPIPIAYRRSNAFAIVVDP